MNRQINITITYSHKFDKCDTLVQYKEVEKTLNMLTCYHPNAEVVFYQELHKNGRAHLHGFIRNIGYDVELYEIINLKLYRQFGNVKLYWDDPGYVFGDNSEYKTWEAYCKKENNQPVIDSKSYLPGAIYPEYGVTAKKYLKKAKQEALKENARAQRRYDYGKMIDELTVPDCN